MRRRFTRFPSACAALAVMCLASRVQAGPPSGRSYEGPRAVVAPADADGPPVAAQPDEAPVSDDGATRSVLPPRPTPQGVVKPPPQERMSNVRMTVIDPMKQVRIRPVLDGTLILAALAPGIALDFWVRRSLPDALPVPGTEPEVGRFDRLALGRFDERPAIASDVTAGLAVGLPVLYHIIEAATRRVQPGQRRGRIFAVAAGTDAVVYAQALSINALITQILKVAVRRPRPFAYLECGDVPADRCQELRDAQASPNANWSFPSGHTSRAFAASTAGATLLTLELVGRSRWGIAAAWVAGIGLAGTTGAMRVLAGQHFGSDVFTAALLGAGVGATVPLAHLQVSRRNRNKEASHRSSVTGISIGPMRGPSVTGISLLGFLR